MHDHEYSNFVDFVVIMSLILSRTYLLLVMMMETNVFAIEFWHELKYFVYNDQFKQKLSI